MGAVRLPKILVLTIDDFVSAQWAACARAKIHQKNARQPNPLSTGPPPLHSFKSQKDGFSGEQRHRCYHRPSRVGA